MAATNPPDAKEPQPYIYIPYSSTTKEIQGWRPEVESGYQKWNKHLQITELVQADLLYLILLSLMTNLRHCLRKRTWHKCRFQFVLVGGVQQVDPKEMGTQPTKVGSPTKKLLPKPVTTHLPPVSKSKGILTSRRKKKREGITCNLNCGPHQLQLQHQLGRGAQRTLHLQPPSRNLTTWFSWKALRRQKTHPTQSHNFELSSLQLRHSTNSEELHGNQLVVREIQR